MEKGLFDKVNIIPAYKTNIEHRLTDCNPYYDAFWSTDADALCLSGAHLPLFTAPMACIVNDKNYLEFDNNNVNPIIPRTVPFEKRLELMKNQVWIAVGLDEFDTIIKEFTQFDNDTYICVDIANGHMSKLLGLCQQAKHKFNNLILMTGNIAAPETYLEYAKIGIDYVRVSIGSGSGCCTNTLTGIGYDPVTLLEQIKMYKSDVIRDYNRGISKFKSVPNVVFDGGCKSIRDIIMALALCADYVMCGKIFAKCEEACGEIIEKEDTVQEDIILDNFTPKRYICSKSIKTIRGRMYYGMSTERAQREMGNSVIKHSEGKEFWIPIEYNLKDWISQFVAALTSSMSYCNTKTLNEFIGNVRISYGGY